jgi:glycosyltransferase involved in cell wall biosynthesis
MIRVGFILAYISAPWSGGVNYFRNLLDAVLSLPDRKMTPVIFLSRSRDFDLTGLERIEVIRSPLFDRWHPLWVLRKAIFALYKRDVLLESMMKRYDIRILSHSGHLGRSASIPAIAWIPDFQHFCKPEFFSHKSIQRRNSEFNALCKYCRCIILSSHDALGDLQKFCPQAQSKARVLQFVAGLVGVGETPQRRYLEEKYGFSGLYFHLPNNFWLHKNHQVVVDALGILKQQGKDLLVLATGNIADSQCNNYVQSLLASARRVGVADRFRILGAIPYPDLLGLMIHSVAVMNPSLFEGWSSTVEESSSLGRPVIVSDIPVHREQNCPRSFFFPPTDAKALASIMLELQAAYHTDSEKTHTERALLRLPARKRDFGARYQQIVLNCIR